MGSTRTPRSSSSVALSPSTVAGSASRTGEGYHASSVRPVVASIVVSPWAAALGMGGKLAERRQVGLELGAELAAQQRHRPAGEVDVQVLLDRDDELAAVE